MKEEIIKSVEADKLYVQKYHEGQLNLKIKKKHTIFFMFMDYFFP